MTEGHHDRLRLARRIAIGLAIAGVFVIAVVALPLRSWAFALATWIRGAGLVGVVVFVIAYVAAALLLLPGSALTLGAGFAYGPILGTLIVAPASVLAATLAFAVSRRGGRGRVAERIARDPRFAAIDRAVGRSGRKLVLLLRLSPVFPYSLLNYALGLSAVRARDYVLASIVGMLPGTILYVYLGSAVTTATELSSGSQGGSSWARALFWIGLACAAIVVIAITRIARRALAGELANEAGEVAS